MTQQIPLEEWLLDLVEKTRGRFSPELKLTLAEIREIINTQKLRNLIKDTKKRREAHKKRENSST